MLPCDCVVTVIPHVKTLPSCVHQKPLAVPDPSKRATCELPEIVSLVLSFVTDIAVEQASINKQTPSSCDISFKKNCTDIFVEQVSVNKYLHLVINPSENCTDTRRVQVKPGTKRDASAT